jgi:hypothetical protein
MLSRILQRTTGKMLPALFRMPLLSEPVAREPDKDNENDDQTGRDGHPDLCLEAKKTKVLDQKLHVSPPFLVQNKRFACAA